MSTTCVRDSVVGDQWIQQTAALIPVQRIINKDTGLFEGDIMTGPVRLSFFDDSLMQLPKPMTNAKGEPQGEPKFGSHLLFTPYADFTIFYEEYYKTCAAEFPEFYDAGSGQYLGLVSPFKDQAERAAKYAGYTPGLTFLNSTSLYKPQVVDVRQNPIIDKSKVYPGIWANCVVRPYPSGKGNALFKKGVQFGLQSVMIIGDDSKFGATGPDAKALYAGIGPIAPPPIRPGQVAGMPTGAPPAPAAGIPGYTQPGGRPGAPAGAPPPVVPRTHFQPPAPGGFTPPAATGPAATACFCGSGLPANLCCEGDQIPY